MKTVFLILLAYAGVASAQLQIRTADITQVRRGYTVPTQLKIIAACFSNKTNDYCLIARFETGNGSNVKSNSVRMVPAQRIEWIVAGPEDSDSRKTTYKVSFTVNQESAKP